MTRGKKITDAEKARAEAEQRAEMARSAELERMKAEQDNLRARLIEQAHKEGR